MLIGLATLISILFFGGAGEIFYVDNLEKGIKKYVLEKERKKEILTDIKNTKAIFKEFEKERKQDFKNFSNLYAEKNTSIEQLDSLFKDLVTKRTNFYAQIIDQRILIFDKIKDEQWDNIVKTSKSAAEKRVAKIEKKAIEGQEYFLKTKERIDSDISNKKNKETLLSGLEEVGSSAKDLEKTLLSINSNNNAILANKKAGRAELLKIFTEDSEHRNPVFESMISYHKIARENCSDDEWEKIMKTFTKELHMSSR